MFPHRSYASFSPLARSHLLVPEGQAQKSRPYVIALNEGISEEEKIVVGR